MASGRNDTTKWGVDRGYRDALGNWRHVTDEIVTSVHRCMGIDAKQTGEHLPGYELPGNGSNPVQFIYSGNAFSPGVPGTLVLESGEEHRTGTGFLEGIPEGYHCWNAEGTEAETEVICAPRTCWLPESLQTWGFSVQLYSARSRESWGIGDLRDLRAIADWSHKELGAGMLLLNPLSAAAPTVPQQGSPYYPTSRAFYNPLFVHIPDVPGARESGISELETLGRTARALNGRRIIDRDRVFALKMQALNLLWEKLGRHREFLDFCRERGEPLHKFSTFCALAEHYGTGWHGWPQEFRHPANPAVARFAESKQDRVDFYRWLQWLLDQSLAKAAGELALMQDLPIGVDPDGADAWAWQDVLAANVGVGAPPDEFNTQGQDWGLPPFIPHKLRACGYRPFVETIRAAFRHCGGLRIDHVMGLFRLFWVPAGVGAAEGAYVRYREQELLSILALESQRARAYVVGEDLGTVEDDVRTTLARHRILSYRLLWFEKESPAMYPIDALAAVTTHDLPTVTGLWTGSDLARQQELGLKPNIESTAEIRQRLMETANLRDSSHPEDVVSGAYRSLSAAPCRILTATLEDVMGVEERPNIPATNADQNPNWSLALPESIDTLFESPLASNVATHLRERQRLSR